MALKYVLKEVWFWYVSMGNVSSESSTSSRIVMPPERHRLPEFRSDVGYTYYSHLCDRSVRYLLDWILTFLLTGFQWRLSSSLIAQRWKKKSPRMEGYRLALSAYSFHIGEWSEQRLNIHFISTSVLISCSVLFNTEKDIK